MIPEIGNFALILALCLALIQGTLPLIGAATGRRVWMNLGRSTVLGQFLMVSIAFVCLTYAFIVNDFSVLYAAMNSNSQLPLQYRIAAVWGGHEGSLLLWALLLAAWALAVSMFSRSLPEEMVARVLGVMGLLSVGFLLFVLLTSNPFERLLPAALDGRDLNPLLQDPGLIFHPPMLYMGYVGFSVAFSFAIAALLGGKLDASWARWSRPWTTIAWVFLTFGVGLGSWWAYYELGWGGWWFWDPVENSSFMPWLVGTALIHSLAVTEKRGCFRNWTILLAILTFSLSLLGAFLVRSGVLTSVHAFATDPERGVFILGFLVTVIGTSLALYAWRAPKVGMGGAFHWSSRETMLLTNNVLLVVVAGMVLLGTLYPLLLDALNLGKISVGPPYFDAVFVPLMLPLVFLCGLGSLVRWKHDNLAELMIRLRWVFILSLLLSIVIPFMMGHFSIMVCLGLLVAIWVITTTFYGLWQRIVGRSGNRSFVAGFRSLTASYLGMVLAHIGVAIGVIGITLVSGYEIEKDVRMDIGDTLTMGGYEFKFEGIENIEGPNYSASRGLIQVSENGEVLTMLHPEKRIYNVQTMPMTEAAIDSSIFRDLYVSMGDSLGGTAWAVRVYYKPFISWLWMGCFLMGLGGLLAVSDRRYRLAQRKNKKKVVVPEMGMAEGVKS
ncbi:MAG: heme lyase CcmF/NrfE family subunit [Gammaproteobacteria bacterium]|nr:heme lyase CcmF/NrfE family subunit [Gammaproteobacteria bacterium]